jgi:hypothetical protein
MYSQIKYFRDENLHMEGKLVKVQDEHAEWHNAPHNEGPWAKPRSTSTQTKWGPQENRRPRSPQAHKKLRQPPLHPYIRRPPPPSTTHNTQEPLSLSHLHYVVLGSSGAKARAFLLVVLSNSSGRLAPTFGLQYSFVLNLSLLYLYRA